MQQAGKGFVEAGAAAAAGSGTAAAVVRDEASCIVQEGSGDSGSTLKAHDYIGLSEVTSMPLKPEGGGGGAATAAAASGKPLPDLNLGETELRLGPPKAAAKDPANIPLPASDKTEQQQQQPLAKDGGAFWQQQARMIQQDVQAAPPPPSPVDMYCNVASMNKNKRVFSETIGSNGQFVEGRSVMPNPPGIASAGGAAGAPSSSHGVPTNQGSNGKVAGSGAAAAPPLMPSSMYPWNNSSKLPAAWRMGLEQSKSSFGPFPSSSRIQQPKMKDEPTNNGGSPNSSGLTSSKEEANEDPPPSASPPVVGWPPVQSFRKNTLASHPPPPPQHKSSETGTKSGAANTSAPAPATANAAAAAASPLFVKVYMDGVPIGRKVDLKSNNSYEKLSSVLEDMFLRFITGQNGSPEVSSLRDPSEKKLNFLQSSDFVLTYEDKDGDLMLVGDVPWGMFTGTVKRLRIMKGSEAIGLAPRAAAAAAAGDKAQA